MKSATIYDVAKKADVSLATVSRVLNNPEKVKESTRLRVLEAIKELEYRPNLIARGLASKKTTTVGVVVSDITRASIAEMLAGIMDIANNYKYSVKLFQLREEDDPMHVLRNVISEQVDGVLFLNDEQPAEVLVEIKNELDASNIPLVFCNIMNEDSTIPTVSIDYRQAGYEVTKKLIDEGRKNIYLLSTARRYATNDDKEAGYLKAMEEAGLMPRIFRTSGNTNINRLHFETFFSDKEVDGAIGVRDSIAISFMNIAQEKGVIVPRDLSVIGFQNTKYSVLSRPGLTSIHIPVYDIGAVSMRLLTKFMSKSDDIDNLIITLPHFIEERSSTK